MKELFKSYDQRVLKSKPLVWITALHWMLPLAILLCVLTYLYGWFFPYNIDITEQVVGDFMYPAVWITALCVVILVVVYFIRQVRFNALRVHHSLPYKKPYFHFVVFFITLFCITAIPHLASLGTLHKCSYSIDQEHVQSDLETMDLGSTHFMGRGRYVYISQREYDTLPETLQKVAVTNDIFQDNDRSVSNNDYQKYVLPSYSRINDSLYLIRTSMYNYYGVGMLESVSVEDAKKEIEDFKKVAYKYGGRFGGYEPDEIINRRINFSRIDDKTELDNSGDYNLVMNYNELRMHYSIHSDILENDGVFYAGSWLFWKYYFTLPFFLSILLFVLSATELRDFGWALLVGSLTFVFAGIAGGLFTVVTSFAWEQRVLEWFWLFLISALVMLYVYIIFGSKLRSGIKRAFGIALHLLVPTVFWSYWLLGDELHECHYDDVLYDSHQDIMPTDAYFDLGYLLLVLVCIVSIYLFNRYYTRQYVHPKR